MDKETFNNLLKDNKVIKFEEWSGNGFFLSQNKKVVVNFSFDYNGYSRQVSTDSVKRITLYLFPIENLNVDIPLIKVPNEFVVLVNSNNENYALSYLITIDEEIKSATVKIKDYPERGLLGITDVEKQGLTQIYKI